MDVAAPLVEFQARLDSAAGWNSKVQRAWAERPIGERVGILRSWRHRMARSTAALTEAVAAEPQRTAADVRVSEILPLLAACEYLEVEASKILSPRVLGRSRRPLWLGDVQSEVHRVALGRILVIGPSNYPLFLPGVQVLQALTAGNAVTWKPGRGGGAAARLVSTALFEAGLPAELLRVTEESIRAGEEAIDAGTDKVFFTGSAVNGRAVMRRLAETVTPSVMELSGCSSVIVMPDAELGRVTAAMVFGIRLNGGATCMAPRRLVVVSRTTARRDALVRRLVMELGKMERVALGADVHRLLSEAVREAQAEGAVLHGNVSASEDEMQGPLVLLKVTPKMRIAKIDVFAPVLSVIDVADADGAVSAERACPLALSVSIFGEESAARRMAARMTIGTVIINDVIVPTADPRIPFGGRRGSGFGVTRGTEGLLEMTAITTILVRHGSSERHFQPTSARHTTLFDGLIQAGHSETWVERWRGLRTLAKAARGLMIGPTLDRETDGDC